MNKDIWDIKTVHIGKAPMGVETYANVKIQEIQQYLPTAEQIQQQIKIAEEEYKLTLQKKDSHEDA